MTGWMSAGLVQRMVASPDICSDFQSVHIELDALGEWQRAAEIDRVGGTV